MTSNTEFPFASHYLEVLGSKMHYLDEGDASETGLTFLCLHGNPTSSYLWRKVIPHLKEKGRVVAPDLIGMGKSDKPELGYRFVDHARYLDAFIEQMGLKNVVLVIHDWGSALGFHYARRHEDNVKGIAFMEAIVGPVSWKEFPASAKMIFRLFRNRFTGPLLIQGANFFVKQVLPKYMYRKMTHTEKDAYAEPYPDYASRKPLYVWPNEIPIDGTPKDTYDIVKGYNEWLHVTPLPKLLLWAKPGALISEDNVAELERGLSNLQTHYIGRSLHYVQEDHPNEIGQTVASWASEL